MAKDIKKGCVVYMNADSGMKGYGNPQCVSWVSHELGELSLYGHNEHYKTYDVREVVEPSPEQDELKSLKKNVGRCIASANGTLDALEMDNTCDVIEKSYVIKELKELISLLIT